jgi:DNA-binding NarL/FixJ family response regulator
MAVGDVAVIRLIVVSEARLHREALASALAEQRWSTLVASVASLEEAMPVAAGTCADIVLLDLQPTPENLDALAASARAAPLARFVVFGTFRSEGEIVAWAEAGASGILESGSSVEELHAVLEAVTSDQLRCSPRIAGALLRRVQQRALERAPADTPASEQLTARQLEILELIANGLTNKEIAARLAIRQATVKNHVHHIFGKLGVHSRAAATMVALTPRQARY